MFTVFGLALVISTVVLFGFDISAQTNEIVQPPGELEKTGLEQLFDMEVTTSTGPAHQNAVPVCSY